MNKIVKKMSVVKGKWNRQQILRLKLIYVGVYFELCLKSKIYLSCYNLRGGEWLSEHTYEKMNVIEIKRNRAADFLIKINTCWDYFELGLKS